MASHTPASTWQLGPEDHATHLSAPVVPGYPPLLLSSCQNEPCLPTLPAQSLCTPWLLGGEHSRVIQSRNNHLTRETEPCCVLTLPTGPKPGDPAGLESQPEQTPAPLTPNARSLQCGSDHWRPAHTPSFGPAVLPTYKQRLSVCVRRGWGWGGGSFTHWVINLQFSHHSNSHSGPHKLTQDSGLSSQ